MPGFNRNKAVRSGSQGLQAGPRGAGSGVGSGGFGRGICRADTGGRGLGLGQGRGLGLSGPETAGDTTDELRRQIAENQQKLDAVMAKVDQLLSAQKQ